MWWAGAAFATEFGVVEVRHHDPGAGALLPTVVLIHGYGATPEDIVHVYDGYPGPLRVLALRGPAPIGDGYTWYDLPGRPEVFPGDRETEFRQRALELGGFLEALAAKEPLASPPVIAGFSQGGMTAFLVAARAPELVSGAIPISGNLPVTLVPAALAPAVPVRALHGGADPRIPVATAQETVAAFVARGGDATLETFPDAGHTISPEMRARLWTLTATLTGPTP